MFPRVAKTTLLGALLGAVRGGTIRYAATGSAASKPYPGLAVLAKMNHIVVIYEENHSFDNLYGGWEGVNGLSNSKVKQVNQSGAAFNCLMQQDVNLTVPPLAVACTDSTSTPSTFSSQVSHGS